MSMLINGASSILFISGNNFWKLLGLGDGQTEPSCSDDEHNAFVVACERWRRARGGEHHGITYKIKTRLWSKERKWRYVTKGVRAGIPEGLKARLWYLCSGGWSLCRQSDVSYVVYKERGLVTVKGTDAARTVYQDLQRTGVPDDMLAQLEHLLLAFVARRPEIGYCQSMNFIAARLLQHCSEADAFWVFCSIVENLLPEGYYTATLQGLRADLRTLDALVAAYLPDLHMHLTREQCDLSPIITNWFLCLFVRTLPPELSLRVMDCFLHEGSKVLFRTALGLLKSRQTELLQCRSPSDAYLLLRAPLGRINSEDGSPSDHLLTHVDLTEDAFMDTMVYGLWLQGLDSETIGKLREESLGFVQEQDAAIDAKRKMYFERKLVAESAKALQVEAEVQTDDDEAENEGALLLRRATTVPGANVDFSRKPQYSAEGCDDREAKWLSFVTEG